jgi:hypothetical protein
MAHRVIPFLALFVLACSGLNGDGTSGDAGTSATPLPLTCAWAASEANCWKQTLEAAQACLPPQSEVGVFARTEDLHLRRGKVVEFDPAASIRRPPGLTSRSRGA